MACRRRGAFMVRGLTFAVALALGTISVPVHALGLGGIKTTSALNQNFSGLIELRSVEADELPDLRVKLADAKAFAKAGLERPFFLTLLKFRPMRLDDGRAVIRVTSDFPIREPFLDFLVEVDWPKGHLIREYTVLLDPPVTTRRKAPAVQTTRAPARQAAPDASPTPPGAARRSAVTEPAGTGEYGPVSANDTLWSIAKKLRPAGVTMAQMVMALFQANPEAFVEGDMNRLKRGQILRVPPPEEIRGISRAEAAQAYRQAQEQWRNRRSSAKAKVSRNTGSDTAATKEAVTGGAAAEPEPQAELRIATARPEGKGEPGASEDRGDEQTLEEIKHELLIARENAESSRIETEALRNEMDELRKRLDDMQRLLMLKDQQLAQLQAKAEEGAKESGMSASEASVGQAPAESEEAAPELSEAPSNEITVEEEAAAPAEETVGEETSESDTVVVEDEGEGNAEGEDIDADLMAAADAVLDEGLAGETKPASAPAAPTTPAEGGAVSEEPVTTPVMQQAGTPEKVAPVPEKATEPGREQSQPGSSEVSPGASDMERLGAEIKRFVQDNLPVVAGAGGALVLLLLLLGLRRGSKKPEETPLEAAVAAAGGAAAVAETTAEDADIAAITPDSHLGHEDETSFLSEFSPSDVNALRDETGEVDPVSEADVYIAYGRYQQAEDLLKQSLSRDPDRLALKHKLLEVYFATRNKEAFNALAQSMVEGGQDIVDQDAWARIRDMGRELDPHNSLYAEADTAAPEVAADDVDAEAGPDLDSEITTEFVDALDQFDEDSVLDEPSLDLDDLKELEDLDQLEAETRPLEEVLDLELSGEDGGNRRQTQVDDQVSSLELPSLDLADEGALSEEEPVAKELQAQLEELSDLSSLEGDLSRLAEDLEEPEGLDIVSSGLDEPIELDQAFEKGLDSDVDLDIDSLTPESVDAEAIETKLDLAKAFLEMGDNEGARDILEEIRQEGNDSQRQQAEQLLADMA
ncbi:MAG: hypothetical protein D6720_12375 [Gammaproteobacteria bacterium]|nr:MAG: hypothetical protein D6720_12375 [Gammaproteobacteria bacterium]